MGGVRGRPDGRRPDRPHRPPREARPVPRRVLPRPPCPHAGGLAAQKACALPMLRLLNFRCSFCSNPLDETQNTCGRRLQPIARYRPHPLQQRGHAARRGQAADRSAEPSTRSPRLDFGAVTNLCDATSALTAEGDLHSSLAISLHEALRSGLATPIWTIPGGTAPPP